MHTESPIETRSSDIAETEDSVRCSLVIPVYMNELNIPELLVALDKLTKQISGLEVVFVIDGSPDRSGKLLVEASSALSFRHQIIFLSRNFGSFTAIRTGLSCSNGKHVAVMAADLQEPPDLVIKLFASLDNGADIAFGQRTGRDDGKTSGFVSSLYWRLYKTAINKDIPKGGVDIFACNRSVIHALLSMKEAHTSLIAQLFWLGFKRDFVEYKRLKRTHGKSGWSLSKKFNYFLDSVFSFTDLPIRAIMYLGIVGIVFTLLFAGFTLIARLFGYIATPGYASIVLLVTFLFSILLFVQGILGTYIWRAFENTKGRPISVIARHITRT